MEKVAVLVDISGKQNYIFSSNKLKDIVGASEIIRQVTSFKEIEKFCKENLNLNEISGNFGGGNALLFFGDVNLAKEFINKYSKFLLINYPSLVVYFGLNLNFDEDNFKESSLKTHQILDELKNSFYPLSQPLSLGFEELCANSDFPATKPIITPENKKTHISKATKSKQDMSESANKNFNEIYKDVLIDKYIFSLKLDEITHNDKSFIAVAHIDANDLGKKVKNLKSKDDYAEFSEFIDRSMKLALENTIEKLIQNLEKFYFTDILRLNIHKDSKSDKLILPFRPIILSGDDFTFVSEGRLGVWITKTFMNEVEKIEFPKDEKPLYTSGGVAIVKAKTPFFRAYEIAENLTDSAKKLTRSNAKIKTSLDFIITSSHILGDLEYLRENLYTNKDNKFYNGGYDKENFTKLLNLMNEFSEISKTKVMKIRELLFENEENLNRYLKMYCDKQGEKLVNKDKKLFLEAIELLNFYPKQGGKYE